MLTLQVWVAPNLLALRVAVKELRLRACATAVAKCQLKTKLTSLFYVGSNFGMRMHYEQYSFGLHMPQGFEVGKALNRLTRGKKPPEGTDK